MKPPLILRLKKYRGPVNRVAEIERIGTLKLYENDGGEYNESFQAAVNHPSRIIKPIVMLSYAIGEALQGKGVYKDYKAAFETSELTRIGRGSSMQDALFDEFDLPVFAENGFDRSSLLSMLQNDQEFLERFRGSKESKVVFYDKKFLHLFKRKNFYIIRAGPYADAVERIKNRYENFLQDQGNPEALEDYHTYHRTVKLAQAISSIINVRMRRNEFDETRKEIENLRGSTFEGKCNYLLDRQADIGKGSGRIRYDQAGGPQDSLRQDVGNFVHSMTALIQACVDDANGIKDDIKEGGPNIFSLASLKYSDITNDATGDEFYKSVCNVYEEFPDLAFRVVAPLVEISKIDLKKLSGTTFYSNFYDGLEYTMDNSLNGLQKLSGDLNLTERRQKEMMTRFSELMKLN